MDKTDLKYQEVEQENYAVVAAEAVESTPLGADTVVPAVDADQAKNDASLDDQGLALTDEFTRILCCAYTCGNVDYDFGCKSGGTCLCFEWRDEMCRFPKNDDKTCFLLDANSLECIYPRKCYRDYRQCCCFECFASFPIPESGVQRLPKLMKERDIGPIFVPSMNVLYCCPLYYDCCSYRGLNCDFPSCIGMHTKAVVLCFEHEAVASKAMCCVDNKPDPHTLCVCYKTANSIVTPYTLIKGIGSFFCLDYRAAFPCDEEVPCIWSLCCFCTLCVDWKCNVTCCRTIAQITGYELKQVQRQQELQQKQFQAQQQQFEAQQLQVQALTQQQQQQVPIAQAQVIQVEMTPTAPVKQE